MPSVLNFVRVGVALRAQFLHPQEFRAANLIKIALLYMLSSELAPLKAMGLTFE